MVRLDTYELHDVFAANLGNVGVRVDDLDAPVLELEMAPPYPERLRVYMFNATNPPGGRVSREHKIQLSVPGQGREDRGNFDFDGATVLLVGKVEDQAVFVLWDAYLYENFTWSGNVQVRTEVIEEALATGTIQTQERRLRLGVETVIVAPAFLLAEAILMRMPAGGPAGDLPPAAAPPPPTPAWGGRPYVVPPRGDGPPEPETRVFQFDPNLLDRGTNAHKDVQDQLAAAIRAHGLVPLSPEAGDPDFDAAWVEGDVAFIAEVKSLTDDNEEKQLRLGLGQLLSYLYRLEWAVGEVQGVLAVEREPTAPYWLGLCATHNVILTWPDGFPGLFGTDH